MSKKKMKKRYEREFDRFEYICMQLLDLIADRDCVIESYKRSIKERDKKIALLEELQADQKIVSDVTSDDYIQMEYDGYLQEMARLKECGDRDYPDED